MNWHDDNEDEIVDEEAPAAPDFGPGPTDAPGGSDDPWFDDALAAHPSPTRQAVEAEQQAVERAEEDEDWSPEKGFPDRTNAVRIWVDDEGLPCKVRISLSWREKLRSGSLGEAVTQCFLLINHFHHVYGQETATDVALDDVPEERLSRAERAELKAQIDDLAAQLGTRTPGSYRTMIQTWEPAVGSDFQDGVLVQLDATGRPAFAKFDPKWLATANSKELATGILTAFKRARARYRPPQVRLTAEGELLRRMNELTARLLKSQPTD